MKILSYNTRGLGGKIKRRAIRELIIRENIDLACFQETKLQNITVNLCKQLWGDNNFDWAFSPSVNLGRGLLCAWRIGSFMATEKFLNDKFIGLKGFWGEEGAPCTITNVYAPCDLGEKIRLWEDLVQCRIRSNCQNWCLLGEFNAVCGPEERRGAVAAYTQNRRESENFNKFIEAVELMDIPLLGKKFTWYRPNGLDMSRLDRFLVSNDWLLSWPDSVQEVLQREIFYHCPILLRLSRQEWGPRPFRVLNCWFHDPRFKAFVEASWSTIHVSGWGAFVLKEKLKALKLMLKTWNKEEFDDINSKRRAVVEEINASDRKAEAKTLNATNLLGGKI